MNELDSNVRKHRAVTFLTEEEKDVMLPVLARKAKRSESDTIRILIREAFERLQMTEELQVSL